MAACGQGSFHTWVLFGSHMILEMLKTNPLKSTIIRSLKTFQNQELLSQKIYVFPVLSCCCCFGDKSCLTLFDPVNMPPLSSTISCSLLKFMSIQLMSSFERHCQIPFQSYFTRLFIFLIPPVTTGYKITLELANRIDRVG